MTARKAPAKKAPASVAAREAEAEDGYAIVEHCGVELRIPVGGKMPAAVIDAYLVGGSLAPYRAMLALIGEEQWRKLVDAGATQGDLLELDKIVGGLAGN